MALFRKKQPNGDANGSSAKAEFTPQPEKARKWFEHAKATAMASNYAYALECYANGIKLDPGVMSAHASMWDAAVRYMNQDNSKPASGKDIKQFDDGTPVGRLAAAEFAWMKDLKNQKAGVKALEAAVKAEQFEVGNWFAPKVLGLIKIQKKLSKSMLMQTMALFRDVGAWDESMTVGEMARELDPADSDLDSQLKNLSAQRAMDQGGYADTTTEEGGFRKFIKDDEKQRELIEEESLAGAGSSEERVFARAKAAYEATPTVPDVINRYAQLLKKQGTPDSAQAAGDLYQKGFEDTGEYRFRMAAGDIRIELMVAELRGLDEKLESGGDDGVRGQRDALNTKILELKTAEYTDRVAKYPTDRVRKFHLGMVEYELERYQEAMEQFQKSKDEPKLRVQSGHMLGRCFYAEKWYSEAITEYEEALQVIEVTEKDREQALRYDLMLALIEAAREEDSIDLAKQAKSICSEIARRDITYRDIRAKRKEVDKVIAGLTGPRE
ncbi:MAG: hypothetical protein GY715_05865 [Planctomycetes bacterium]|nr:hypothetical protein [Planctomycetota bacterium]